MVKHGRTPKAFELSKYTGKETYPDGEFKAIEAAADERVDLDDGRLIFLVIPQYGYIYGESGAGIFGNQPD